MNNIYETRYTDISLIDPKKKQNKNFPSKETRNISTKYLLRYKA